MNRTLKSIFTAFAAAGVAALLAAGCAAPPAAPEDQFYRLDTVATASGEMALKGVVEVERFSASGSLGNRPLLFTEPGSNAVSEYHYHFWIDAPPVLLQSALVSYLRSSGVAERVVTPEMRVSPDYTVTGRVLRLETVRGDKSAGAAALELTLRRESDGALLVLGEYRSEIPSGTNGVQTDAAAVEKAVAEAFARFVADIRKAPAKKGP